MSELVLGSLIVPVEVPPALTPESASVFRAGVGRTLRVDDLQFDAGNLVGLALNVHDDGSQAGDWCQHTIYREPELVRHAGLTEVEAWLPNGFHDFNFDSIHLDDSALHVSGQAWVGNSNADTDGQREARLPVELRFFGPREIRTEGGAFTDLPTLAGDSGHVLTGEPVRLFLSSANLLFAFTHQGFAAAVRAV